VTQPFWDLPAKQKKNISKFSVIYFSKNGFLTNMRLFGGISAPTVYNTAALGGYGIQKSHVPVKLR
jgi:hypothetical protein